MAEHLDTKHLNTKHLNTKHLNIEDMEKYLEADMSEQYLLWLEKAEEHLSSCESCQAGLRRFMMADEICSDYRVTAMSGMQQIEEEVAEQKERESLATRLTAFFAGTALAQEAAQFADSLKKGMAQTLMQLQGGFAFTPCVVRGDVGSGHTDVKAASLTAALSETAREAGVRVEYRENRLYVTVSAESCIGRGAELLMCCQTEGLEQFAVGKMQVSDGEMHAAFEMPKQVENLRIYVKAEKV